MEKKLKKINEKVVLKAKNLTTYEYESIMNLFRASMIFFEKELRRLRDKDIIREETLREINKKFDISELVRLRFSTISPTKVVKMEDVKRVVHEFTQSELATSRQQRPNQPRTIMVPSPTESPPPPIQAPPPPLTSQPSISFVTTKEEPSSISIPPYQSESIQTSPNQSFPSPPPSQQKSFSSTKDTATAVMELRKLMIENLQRFRERYKE